MNKKLKTHRLEFAIGVALGVSVAPPIFADDGDNTIYCVHDGGLNNSQFCYIPIPPVDSSVVTLGPVYQKCDIEALDIQHGTDNLYAASGDDTPRPGHLYYVYKHNGNVIDLGDVDAQGAELAEIDAISFRPNTGNLWGWAQGEGLFMIPSSVIAGLPSAEDLPIQPVVDIDHPICLPPTSPVPVIHADLILPAPPVEVEDITWNWEGDVLYAVENVHATLVDGQCQSHDPDSHGPLDFEECDVDNDGVDEGIRLWAVAQDGVEWKIGEICPNLAPQIAEKLGKKAEIEGLESLPESLLPDEVNQETEDLLLVGFHGAKKILYAVIITPEPPFASDPNCQIWRWLDHDISTKLNDIEGLAYSPNPKPSEEPQSVAKSCQEILENDPSSEDGVYQIDPDGEGGNEPFDVYCDMADDGGWTLAFLKNSVHNGSYHDFASTYENTDVLSITPEDASLSASGLAGWLNLNDFDYEVIRLASYSVGGQTFISNFIYKADLRINFGENGYLLYNDPNGYYWCGGDRNFTDYGIGQINQPAGAPNDCKGHGSLGDGWDFSHVMGVNQGLTLCGNASTVMHKSYGGAWIFYGNSGAAYAIWAK